MDSGYKNPFTFSVFSHWLAVIVYHSIWVICLSVMNLNAVLGGIKPDKTSESFPVATYSLDSNQGVNGEVADYRATL